jgi:hypothetical protein
MLAADYRRYRPRPSSGPARSGRWSMAAADGTIRSTSTSRKDRSSRVTGARRTCRPGKGTQGRLSAAAGRQHHVSPCSSATGAACSWSIATTPCRGQRDAAALGKSTAAESHSFAPLPTPIPSPTGVEFRDGYDLRGLDHLSETIDHAGRLCTGIAALAAVLFGVANPAAAQDSRWAPTIFPNSP